MAARGYQVGEADVAAVLEGIGKLALNDQQLEGVVGGVSGVPPELLAQMEAAAAASQIQVHSQQAQAGMESANAAADAARNQGSLAMVSAIVSAAPTIGSAMSVLTKPGGVKAG